MSATRDPDRIFRAWLEQMPSEAPDRAIAAVLQATEAAPQVRAWPWLGRWRPNQMNRLSIIAATAAVLVALAGGAILLTSGGKGPAQPTAAPSVAATPVPTPAVEGPGQFDSALSGLWVAEPGSISGLPDQGSRIQLGFDWGDRLTINVQTNYATGTQTLRSTSLAATPGQLRLRAQSGVNGCSTSDVATYSWQRSTDGLFLTLALIEDTCVLRATTFARTWVRTLGGVNDGGTGMALMADPYPDMQVTLPKLTWGMQALPPVDIGTFGQGDPERHFTIFLNPQGFADGCATTARGEFQIEKTTEALRAYIEGLPATSVTATPTAIGGLAAAHITGVTTAKSCAAGQAALFYEPPYPGSNGGPGEIGFTFGETLSLWAVVVDGDLVVIAYTGSGVATADEQAIMDTIKFTNGLPTP